MTDMHAPDGLITGLAEGGSVPAITWLDPDGRIEVSRSTLSRWAAKTAGYLHDDLGLAPGDSVRIAASPHWLDAAVLLGSWACGLEVRISRPHTGGPADDTPPLTATADDPATDTLLTNSLLTDALFTDAPATDGADREDETADEIIAVEHRPLALRWMGPPLPPLTRDFLSEVRAYPDQLTVHEHVDRDAVALRTAYGTLAYGEIFGGDRAEPRARCFADLTRVEFGAWLPHGLACGASFVLADGPREPRLLEQEGVTRMLGGAAPAQPDRP